MRRNRRSFLASGMAVLPALALARRVRSAPVADRPNPTDGFYYPSYEDPRTGLCNLNGSIGRFPVEIGYANWSDPADPYFVTPIYQPVDPKTGQLLYRPDFRIYMASPVQELVWYYPDHAECNRLLQHAWDNGVHRNVPAKVITGQFVHFTVRVVLAAYIHDGVYHPDLPPGSLFGRLT